MNFTTNRLSALALAAGLLGIGRLQPAQATTAPAYQLQALSAVGYGADINNAGLVVGASGRGPLTGQPVTWLQGTTTSLPQPSPVVTLGGATGVSRSGLVVGTAFGLAGLRWQGNSYTVLNPRLAGSEVVVLAVNDGGVAVGTAGTELLAEATLWDANGAPRALTSLRSNGTSYAYDINNDGLVVGWSQAAVPGGGLRAVRWVDAVPTALVSLGAGTWDEARGISESGLIVGLSRNAAGRDQAALWIGTFDLAFNLGTLAGNDSSWANAVNRTGQAVGSSYHFADPRSNRAVLWDGFVATDLNLYLSAEQMQAGWRLYDATSINDAGAILVNGVNIVSNEYQAFLLTAVPEPSTWALWLAGLAGVGAATRRRLRAAAV